MIAMFAEEMKVPYKVSILHTWLIKIIVLFIPFMKELPEMMYKYDRDYIFNSDKFNKRFDFKTTTYQDGVKETIALTK